MSKIEHHSNIGDMIVCNPKQMLKSGTFTKSCNISSLDGVTNTGWWYTHPSEKNVDIS